MADNNMIPIMNARADAVAFISTGRKTSGKVRLKLKLKGHSEEVIAEVIRQLTEEMRIDDLAYARDLIRSRKGKRSLSINALRIRLSDAGLSRDSVSSALNEIHDI
ncbi:MAG: RecX family transcriptional regulator, partial [Eubacteriales bacterium]|nr:RecX family transcriptional regulator [Eubacteriales bacterium]